MLVCWITSSDGHTLGMDGFAMPRCFAEFYERRPRWVRAVLMNFYRSKSRLHDIEDIEQDVLVWLAEAEVVERFDPAKRGKLTAKSFFGYLKMCITRRLMATWVREEKKVHHRRDNLTLFDGHDEDLGTNDAVQAGADNPVEVNVDDIILFKQFRLYLETKHPQLVSTVDAYVRCRYSDEAAAEVGVTPAIFRSRLNMVKAAGKKFAKQKKRKFS